MKEKNNRRKIIKKKIPQKLASSDLWSAGGWLCGQAVREVCGKEDCSGKICKLATRGSPDAQRRR